MEKWKTAYKDKIPKGQYNVNLSMGEENGLIILLFNQYITVKMVFGAVKAIRLLDEGIVLNDLYEDEALDKYKKDGFSNVIYEIEDGGFSKEILLTGGDYAQHLKLRHFIIITINYNIDIITEWEPDIMVL